MCKQLNQEIYKMTIKKLGLALAVSALASGANAALYTVADDSGNTGGSSLLLAAYDAAATTTLYVDLNALAPNMRVHTFDTNSNQSIDLSSVAAANNFSLANVRWAVVAGDSFFGGTGCPNSLSADLATCGQTFMATVSANETLPTTASTTSINSTILGSNNNWFLFANGMNVGNGNSITFADGNPGQWVGGLVPSQGLWDITGQTGETLGFAMAETGVGFGQRGPINTPTGSITNLTGTWTLDNNTLTYAAVAAIPVPAALWMFASGLVGLAGVARRRKQA
jgi:hypothetical protein